MAGEEAAAGPSPTKAKSRYRRYRRYIVEERQEISACLKYLLFVANFIFWICGMACTILGIYLYAKDYRAVFEAIDIFLNPSILLIVCGCLVFILAFLGCTGALRENICMLKLFSLCLFFAYICLVILAFVVFMLFYSDTKTGLSITSLLQTGVRKYHENDNMRELMDYLQANLACCGATSQGYKDWNMNQLYNCSPANPTPEQCGVPSSCCKAGAVPVVPSPTRPSPVLLEQKQMLRAESIVMASEGTLPTVTSHVVTNPRCGFHAQDKSITDLQNVVYTDGCLQPLQRVFESNAVIIGAVIGAIIIPVCLSVTFSNVLAKQIERQRRLLEKEARREERRKRRNRTKFRDPFAGMIPIASRTGARRATSLDRALDEAPRPSAIDADKETCTKLINEENKKTPAGPSVLKAAGEPARKCSKGRSKSEEKLQAPIIRRSGNPELPPIPAKTSETEKREKEMGKKSEQNETKNHSRPGPSRAPRLEPPIIEKRRRQKRAENETGRRRSRSKDSKRIPYSGPIIVEIESITHDRPPAASGQDIEAPLIVDESSNAQPINEAIDVVGNAQAHNENRRNSNGLGNTGTVEGKQ